MIEGRRTLWSMASACVVLIWSASAGSAGTARALSQATDGSLSASARTLFVEPGGSDSNDCTRGSACLTFARAYSLAGAGDVVEVAAGSYPTQTLTASSPNTTGALPVTFQPPAGIAASQVVVGGIRLIGSDNIVLRRMSFQWSGFAAYHVDRGTDNSTCDGCIIRGPMFIDGSTKNTTLRNGAVGGYVANNRDPQIGDRTNTPGAEQPQNVVLDNMVFHDIDSMIPSAHTECLQVLAVHGLTIRRSKFYRCNVSGNRSKVAIMFSGFDRSAGCTNESTCGTRNDFWDVTIENSWFHGGSPDSLELALNWDNQFGDSYDCRRVLVRNNSIVGGVLLGCNVNSTSEVQVASNIISKSGGFWSSQCGGVFSYNVWESGRGCPGRANSRGKVSYVNRSPDALDLHLNACSFGIGRGSPTGFPGIDIDGQRRPIGAVDPGSDERVACVKPKKKKKK